MILFCSLVTINNTHLVFSAFISRPASLLAYNRASVFFFVIFMFSPDRPEADVSHSILIPVFIFLEFPIPHYKAKFKCICLHSTLCN
jgi:hypothetical protein